MSKKKAGRPTASTGGPRDTWKGGEMVDCIRCGNKPGKRENCPLCEGAGVIKVRA